MTRWSATTGPATVAPRSPTARAPQQPRKKQPQPARTPRAGTLLITLTAATALAGSASANHSWGKYHWARTSNPFTINLGNNTTSAWSSLLSTASSDWTASSVLNTNVVSSNKNRQTCEPTLGRVEVCNYDYGNNGWLGVAQIWIYRGGSHIAQG